MTGIFVNKLVVDRDDAYSKKPRTVHFLRYTGDQLAHRDMRKFTDIIYRNFEELENVEGIEHNRIEIAKLMTSSQSIIIIGTLNGTIISYCLAEVTIYGQRKLMHIYYIYTTPVHRGHGIASYMLNLIHRYAVEAMISTLSLTFDTYNKMLTKFYFDNNFEYDSELRSYQRYDMLVKHL
jgi:GNAT superfamily N-acetyltransferase